MACAACERRRQAMKAMLYKAKAHASRLLALRGGKDAEAAADVPASEADSADAQAEGSGQAGKAGATHGKRRVAKAKGTGAGAGRVSVPRVRKGRGGS